MIAPIFLPHLGCGRRCTYCNQDHITGEQAAPLEERIGRLFATLLAPAEVALYGGDVLGLPPNEIEAVFRLLDPYRDKIAAMRISVRPRTVSAGVASLLKAYNVRTIEVGAPSFNDAILACLNRGHTAEDVRRACRSFREQGFEAGLQVMVGLPGETAHDVRETAANIIDLAPAFIRIYPLVVVEDTPLCRDFRAGRFSPDTLEAAVAKSAFIYANAWTHGIRTIKMGLTANEVLREKVAAGPFHPAFGYLVKSEAFCLAVLARRALSGLSGGDVRLSVNRRDVAHLTGYKRANIGRLAGSGISPEWTEGEGIKEGHFVIESGGERVAGNLADALHSLMSPETPS
jgi:histone acetyltransferase (RNA polymerase elongator complex component)